MSNDFVKQLCNLGLCKGDVVFVHSSMKSLGTSKTPAQFIGDIMMAIGEDGTLMMPAFTWQLVSGDNLYFNAKTTGIEQSLGIIPRTFLHMNGVIRSLHPTHSVSAWGRLAHELTCRHIEDSTPVGANSPLMRMLDYGGKILFVGDVVAHCTFMHGVEEIANAPYALAHHTLRYTLDDGNGRVVEKDMIPHDFKGVGQEYQRILDILGYPSVQKGLVGSANCYLFDARAILDAALEKFKQDPYYFVFKLPD